LLYRIGINLDIEERKRAEFYLAQGRRLARAGSWAFDASGFESWSSEQFEMHGLLPDGKAPYIPSSMHMPIILRAIVTYGSDAGRVPDQAHFGLRVMRQRVDQLHADFVIDGVDAGGTIVSLAVPASVVYWQRSTATSDLPLDAAIPLSRDSGDT
jgi:hypothetical protein